VATLELVLLFLAAVLVSAIIDQIVPRVSSPLIQIALGIAIALIAREQIIISLDPELFLVLFIAPLLYHEAREADKTSLWHNRGRMVSYAIGLVIVTCLIIGFVTNLLIPSIPLAAAFALGAALGPTDAVAVSALSQETSIKPSQQAVLKGESLINDASGLVSFQFAVAAVTTGAFSLLDASVSFVISFCGGIILGIILGFLVNFITAKVRDLGLDSTTFHVLFEVFTPFIVFLIAEPLNVSGVLAVVACGIVNTITPNYIRPALSRMNIVSTSVWQVLTFTLNGIVFVLLGTQLPRAMQSTWDDVSIGNLELLGYILIITVLLQGMRFLWALTSEYRRMKKEDDDHRLNKDDVQSAAIITFAGAKGTITLSIMLTLPIWIGSAENPVLFPQRDLLIFLACGVILVTLLEATFIVPLLAPAKTDEERYPQNELDAFIEILRNVIKELSAQQTPETRRATNIVIRSYNNRILKMRETGGFAQDDDVDLRIRALQWEEEYVLEQIDQGAIYPREGYQYLNRVAHVEMMLKNDHNLLLTFRHWWRRFWSTSRALWRRFAEKLPGPDPTQTTSIMHEIQISSAQHVISKLSEEISRGEIPAENVTHLMMEYQRIVASLKKTSPSVTAFTRRISDADEIARLGLELELEQIQIACDEDRISRATAQRMRENVYLMQLDLENNV
jgi:Na+/H+ antiporter